MTPLAEPTIVDLFCGCGGFGLGAELAGFRTLAAIDIDSVLQSAYKLNFPGTYVLTADISTMEGQFWAFPLGGVRPDGVIGGPPCQGFSRIGKRQKDDPRNSLIGHFFRQVGLLKPKFFIMENVEGLLDETNRAGLQAALDTVPSNYRVIGPVKINAAHYGAPTVRTRVIFVGYDPNEIDPITASDLAPVADISLVPVRDAIGDLPCPIEQQSGSLEFGWARYPNVNPNVELSNYARMMRRSPDKRLGWDDALLRLAHGEISGLTETKHSEAVKQRFGETLAGQTESVSHYPRLAWDGLCPTIRAGTGEDRGSFQSVRPIHPAEPRVITVREGARLQGFPDWFAFNPTKWHSFRMIGNSVSPIVAKELLTAIKRGLSLREPARRRMG